jgi:hypothetical protein
MRIYRHKLMVDELARLPLIDLDATLGLQLAQVLLPGLEVATVGADASHQRSG